ncbi:MAG: hypothetical protein V1742_11835 [Pseudomonadota bacterium]
MSAAAEPALLAYNALGKLGLLTAMKRSGTNPFKGLSLSTKV